MSESRQAWRKGALANVHAHLRRLQRRRRERQALRGSVLFNRRWYLATYPDVAGDPVEHYLGAGAAEGRRPSPWFDAAWYLERNADVAQTGVNPLAHYILFGSAEDRDPNPYFSNRWYRQNNPEAAQARTPLEHYVSAGAAALRDPSPRLDAAWYAECNPEAAAMGLDPLAHFLLVGRAAGRSPSGFEASAARGEPATAARLEAFKALERMAGQSVALFVAHAPEGRLKPNVAPAVAALVEAGLRVVLIAATDRPFTPPTELMDSLAGGYVRDNRGFDFAAWAHLMRGEPGLFAADLLLLINDSVIPASDPARLKDLVEAMRANPADVVGATESWELAWHLQSYCLAFKQRALSSLAMQGFFGEVRSLRDKDEVIRAYEVQLASRLQEAGLTCSSLFASRDRLNETVFHWRELLDAGFPFVKTLTLRGGYEGVDIEGWRETLAQSGFDVAMVEATLAVQPAAEPIAGAWPLLKASELRAPAAEPWKVAFIGPWNYASGLGSASRGYVQALWRTGVRLNLHPIEGPFHIHARTAPSVDVREFADTPDVVVVHMNPDSWRLLSQAQLDLIARARKRIGVWVWEMGHLPPGWRPNFDRVDAIWAPSRYCAEVFAEAAKVPVEVVPHVVPVPPPGDGAGRPEALARLGLPADARLVLYAFDGSSYLVRKNPEALVRAFARSGLEAQGWRLVLKTKHLMERVEEGAALKSLVEATAGASLIDAALSRDDMAGLFAAADIYASPHRSEGFGLTIAEAMAMGKAVVASDFGGSRDFLDATCGYPVPAPPVRLERSHGHYTEGGVWGEVDEAALAAALRSAAERLAAGDHVIGETARRRVAGALSAEAAAAAMRRSLNALLRLETAVRAA